jgi:very-short-patch-repair endonuclease
MTLPEVVLWQAMRGDKLGSFHFRRQHPMGPYVLDFYCAAARLAVEVDGSAHGYHAQSVRDVARDRWLSERAIQVLRFQASEILKDSSLHDALDTILAAATRAGSSPAKRGRGTARRAVEGAKPEQVPADRKGAP